MCFCPSKAANDKPRATQDPSRASEITPRGFKSSPKEPPERPKSGREHPKSGPGVAKNALRAAHERPRATQEHPNILQERPKRGQDGLRRDWRASRCDLDHESKRFWKICQDTWGLGGFKGRSSTGVLGASGSDLGCLVGGVGLFSVALRASEGNLGSLLGQVVGPGPATEAVGLRGTGSWPPKHPWELCQFEALNKSYTLALRPESSRNSGLS